MRIAVVEVDAEEDGEGDEDAVGDLHYCCKQWGEAEALDDYRAEVGYAAVGNVAHYAQGEEEVEFWVEEGLENLVRLFGKDELSDASNTEGEERGRSLLLGVCSRCRFGCLVICGLHCVSRRR